MCATTMSSVDRAPGVPPAQTLIQLGLARGKPSRTRISVEPGQPKEVGATWPCGCVAIGPAFLALDVDTHRCRDGHIRP
jgi:hypothetical protein